MRIIEDNVKKESKITRCTCEYCKSLLAVEEKDIRYYKGMKYFVCPCCGEDSYSDELQDFPTKDTVQFPRDYYHFKNGKDIEDEVINNWVKECIEGFDEDNPNDFVGMRGSGNTVVFVFKNDEEEVYTSYVCKNYYEADIRMEN